MNVGANAVPFWVPARFLLAGAVALAAATSALALRPQLLLGYFATPGALAVVHTLTLGFASTVLVGAMHQLLPVVMVTRLHSARLGTVTFWLLVPGAAGVVAGFATGYRVWLLAAGGTIAVLGLAAFTCNVLLTSRNATSRDAVGAAMTAAAAYLTTTAAVGVLIALSRRIPALAEVVGTATLLHLGLGLAGAFFLAVAGAGHKLLAMFVLSHGVSQVRLRLLTAAIHLGLALLAVEALVGLPLLPYAGLALCVAVTLFLLDISVIVRKRVRRRIGLPLRLFVLAPVMLVATALLGALGHAPAAVAGMLVGFITLAIVGMYAKILGFLTWQHRYGPLVGRAKVPLLGELAIPWLDRCTFCCLLLGVPLVVATQIVPSLFAATVGSVSLAIAAWSLAVQAFWIVFGDHASTPVPAEPAPA